MTNVNKATPNPIFNGIRDDSGRTPPVVLEEIPQHLPLYYIHAQKARPGVNLVGGVDLQRMYGAETLNERGEYYSHQTLGLATTISNANMAMVKSLIPSDAEQATVLLALEVVDFTFDHYLRNADGSVQVDGSGVKQEDTGNSFTGKLLRWIVREVATDDLNSEPIVTGGTLVGDAATTSTVYPIWAGRVSGFGKYGNNVGVRMFYPHNRTRAPGDTGTMKDQQSNIYRIQFVERADANSTAVSTGTINSQQFVDFAFKDGVVNTATEVEYSNDRIITEYQSIEPDVGTIPVYGPLSEQYFYLDNIDTVLTELFTLDTTAGGNLAAKELINILSGVDVDGNDHYGFRFSNDTANLNQSTTHYALGGDDGTIGEVALSSQVALDVTTQWENPELPLVDQLKYPFSSLYDTGFDLNTKRALLTTMGLRPDITVTVCTQDLTQPENDITAEIATGTALRAAARLIPESVIDGTDACRAFIYSRTGELTNSNYKRRLPAVFDIIAKRARYMGAGNGQMQRINRYDLAPRNRVTTMRNLSIPWAAAATRDTQWDLGINYPQSADRRQLFWPAYQSIYSDPTSVLNSEINVLIAVDVIKQCAITWSLLTGDSALTPDQFIDRSNQVFTDLVAGRYDERVIITPVTYFTADDEQRGYSWTMDVTVQMNNMRTVGTFNVIVNRRS